MSDHEEPTRYIQIIVMADRPWTCVECHGMIQTGEHYHSHSGLWSGQWAHYRICVDCQQLWNDIGEAICFGHLSDAVTIDQDLAARFRAIRKRRGENIPHKSAKKKKETKSPNWKGLINSLYWEWAFRNGPLHLAKNSYYVLVVIKILTYIDPSGEKSWKPILINAFVKFSGGELSVLESRKIIEDAEIACKDMWKERECL